MENIMSHVDLQEIRRFLLCTADAHKLYEKFGFSEITSPEFFMSIHQASIYQANN